MGTINYQTSDYITLALNPYDFDDIKEGYIEYLIDEGKTREEAEEEATDSAVYDEMNEYYDDDRANADFIIKKYSPYYFHVTIEPGYYEGLSINIENNFPVFYDDYQEKKEAQKEITQIRKMLEELAGCGYVSTYPGWCTRFADHEGTMFDIAEAIKEMRLEVASTPTWYTYNRCCA